MNSLAHIEINVSNLQKSKDFYQTILLKLKWEKVLDNNDVVGFKSQDKTHLFLVQTEDMFTSYIFHRKNIGLNHIAFRVESEKEVEDFSDFLKEKDIKTLYTEGHNDYSKEYDMDKYLAVFFEDPDRIKLEVVFMK
jgi:catechol 2,3-dioxygenase-like lactoylglutathione lyase family enzyme